MPLVEVHLIDTRNGVRGVINPNYNYDSPSSALFHWEDGNYGCDCNRSIFLYPDEDDEDDVIASPDYKGNLLLCGGPHIKVEKLILKESGINIYSETGEPVPNFTFNDQGAIIFTRKRGKSVF